MPIPGDDPKLVALQDFDQVARTIGYPGVPTPAVTKVETDRFVSLMIARATGKIEAI